MSFTRKHNLHRLAYYGVGKDIRSAIAKEKQIKGGSHQKNMDLINSANPGGKNLYDELFA